MVALIQGSEPGGTNSIPYFASKSVTFNSGAGTGAIGAVPWFTISGQVLIVSINGIVTTNLAGATATLALGVTGSTALFIAATTATTLLTTARIWMSATATANGLAVPAACQNIVIEQNIIGTVGTAAISAGVMRLDVLWRPLSAGATLT